MTATIGSVSEMLKRLACHKAPSTRAVSLRRRLPQVCVVAVCLTGADPAGMASDGKDSAVPCGAVGGSFRKHFETAWNQLQTKAARPQAGAELHAALAESGIGLWSFGFASRGDVMPAVEASARRSVAIDERSSVAQRAAGVVHMANWRWAEARGCLRTSLELDPHNRLSHQWMALFLSARGEFEQARHHARQAVALGGSPGSKTVLGAVHYFSRDYDQLVATMEPLTNEHPEFVPGLDWLAMGYTQQGRHEQAIATYRRALRLSPHNPELLGGLGHALGVAGKSAQAEEIARELEAIAKRCYVPPVQIAYVYLGCDNHHKAGEWLEEGLRVRAWELIFLAREPWADPLRGRTRFQAIVDRVERPRD